MTETTCTPKCWTRALCPVHEDEMYPRGRSAPLEVYHCCDREDDPAINPRHLWDEHDSTRYYHDPDGWAAHEASCARCRGDEDE